MNRRLWTEAEDALVRELFPDITCADLSRRMGRSKSAIYGRAAILGVRKSEAFMASDASGRIARGRTNPRMIATQFKPGQTPANKGKKHPPGWAPGRMAETQFKAGKMAGAAQHNYRPIGSERICRDGYLERKVTDDPSLYPARRWVAVHRLVWEAVHGPIPPGHAVVFKPGCATVEASLITADRLELLSRAELMRRNSYHTRYPKEVAQLIQLKGALQRKINKRQQS